MQYILILNKLDTNNITFKNSFDDYDQKIGQQIFKTNENSPFENKTYIDIYNTDNSSGNLKEKRWLEWIMSQNHKHSQIFLYLKNKNITCTF